MPDKPVALHLANPGLVIDLHEAIKLLPSVEAFEKLTVADAAKTLAAADALEKDLIAVLEVLRGGLAALKESMVGRMDAESIPTTFRVDGVTVRAMVGHLVEPKFDDCLPPGVNEDDPAYITTVENAKEHARLRLVNRLEATSRGHLVLAVHDEEALTNEIAGDDAPTDAHGDPVIPADLVGYVNVRPIRTVLIKSEE